MDSYFANLTVLINPYFGFSDAVTNRETVHAPSHGMSSPSLRQWQKWRRTRVAAYFQLQKTPESSSSL